MTSTKNRFERCTILKDVPTFASDHVETTEIKPTLEYDVAKKIIEDCINDNTSVDELLMRLGYKKGLK